MVAFSGFCKKDTLKNTKLPISTPKKYDDPPPRDFHIFYGEALHTVSSNPYPDHFLYNCLQKTQDRREIGEETTDNENKVTKIQGSI